MELDWDEGDGSYKSRISPEQSSPTNCHKPLPIFAPLALGFEVSGMCRLSASGIRRVGHIGIYEVGLRGFGYLHVLDLMIWEAGNSEICRLALGILLRAWEFGIRSFWEFGNLE